MKKTLLLVCALASSSAYCGQPSRMSTRDVAKLELYRAVDNTLDEVLHDAKRTDDFWRMGWNVYAQDFSSYIDSIDLAVRQAKRLNYDVSDRLEEIALALVKRIEKVIGMSGSDGCGSWYNLERLDDALAMIQSPLGRQEAGLSLARAAALAGSMPYHNVQEQLFEAAITMSGIDAK